MVSICVSSCVIFPFENCTNLFYENMYNIALRQNTCQCPKIQNTCPIFLGNREKREERIGKREERRDER